MPLSPLTTAIAYLGSETFPKSKFEQSTAFKTAKSRIADFFGNTLKIEPEMILDLFDSPESADAQDTQLADFIKKAVAEGVKDLFIYYVGHGGFTPKDDHFYLALQSTRDENPAVSSLTIQILGNTISKNANKIRTYLILDCCFSGAASMGFMSGENEPVYRQFKDVFPNKGVAILCASSKDVRAKIVLERNITMFTEGFELALRNGDGSLNEKFLSLRQLLVLTHSNIKAFNPDDAVRPEIVSPVQIQGDVADVELFENFGYQNARYDIGAKRTDIIKEMIANNFIELGHALIDFVKEYEDEGTGGLLTEGILLASECNDLKEDKKHLDYLAYSSRKEVLYKKIMMIVDRLFYDINPAA